MTLSFHKSVSLKISFKRSQKWTGNPCSETRIPLRQGRRGGKKNNKKKKKTHPSRDSRSRPLRAKSLCSQVGAAKKNNSSHQTAHWPPVLPQICTHSSNQCIPLPFTEISSSGERRGAARRSGKRDMSVGDFTMVQQANILPLRPLGQTQHQAEGLQEWRLPPFFFFPTRFLAFVCVLHPLNVCRRAAASASSRY